LRDRRLRLAPIRRNIPGVSPTICSGFTANRITKSGRARTDFRTSGSVSNKSDVIPLLWHGCNIAKSAAHYTGGEVTLQKSRLDAAFLDRQKRRLTELRKQILQVRRGQSSEQDAVNAESNDGAREFEDDAQKLTTLELEGNLAAADDDRLSNIERALQKIADGTYGLSDGSGAPISVERLEASPEALYTLDEQKSRDVAR
jgi:DnaK suppressor protein